MIFHIKNQKRTSKFCDVANSAAKCIIDQNQELTDVSKENIFMHLINNFIVN